MLGIFTQNPLTILAKEAIDTSPNVYCRSWTRRPKKCHFLWQVTSSCLIKKREKYKRKKSKRTRRKEKRDTKGKEKRERERERENLERKERGTRRER